MYRPTEQDLAKLPAIYSLVSIGAFEQATYMYKAGLLPMSKVSWNELIGCRNDIQLTHLFYRDWMWYGSVKLVNRSGGMITGCEHIDRDLMFDYVRDNVNVPIMKSTWENDPMWFVYRHCTLADEAVPTTFFDVFIKKDSKLM